MSWDITLAKPRPGADLDLFDELGEEDLELFDIAKAKSALEKAYPQFQELEPTWLVYTVDECFGIEVDLDEDCIMLHIHILDESYEEQILTMIQNMSKILHCRAYDAEEGEFLA